MAVASWPAVVAEATRVLVAFGGKIAGAEPKVSDGRDAPPRPLQVVPKHSFPSVDRWSSECDGRPAPPRPRPAAPHRVCPEAYLSLLSQSPASTRDKPPLEHLTVQRSDTRSCHMS